MPCKSWSLPAKKACPAAVFGPDTICGACYADKGMYTFPNVRESQALRFQWVTQCMRAPEGIEEFISTMVGAIKATKNPYFRVHDSGDLFNPTYVRAWAEVCRRLPDVKFYIPTRTWQFMANPKWKDALLELGALPNVALRPSALKFGDLPPKIPGLAAGTTATAKGYTCPAAYQGNQCGSCRVCWDKPGVEVSYHQH